MQRIQARYCPRENKERILIQYNYQNNSGPPWHFRKRQKHVLRRLQFYRRPTHLARRADSDFCSHCCMAYKHGHYSGGKCFIITRISISDSTPLNSASSCLVPGNATTSSSGQVNNWVESAVWSCLGERMAAEMGRLATLVLTMPSIPKSRVVKVIPPHHRIHICESGWKATFCHSKPCRYI